MVAGGAEKLQIITAALAKGLCKVLITTEKTAENLM
jgi:lsr operon transcriptional repressor